MAWARIDDKFLDNPKVRKAGKEATYLYMSALVYASNQLTEGFIGDDVLGLVAFKGFIQDELIHAKTLVSCGLWDRVRGGYSIHDFLEYNPTKAQIEQAHAKKSTAGSKGAQTRWQAKPRQLDSKDDSKPIASAIAQSWQPDGINPSHPIPIPIQVINDDSSSGDPFIDAYRKLTGIEPKKTDEEKAMIQRFTKLGVLPIEYQKAIQEMQSKGYKIASMLSAETWTMNNRNGKRKVDPGADLDKFKKAYRQQHSQGA